MEFLTRVKQFKSKNLTYLVALTFVWVNLISCDQNQESSRSADNLHTSDQIQDFINQLPDHGGKVILPEGEISITTPINLKNNVWLQGQGRSTELIVKDSIGILLKGLKGARISDIAVRSDERHTAFAGIVLDDCGDCVISKVYTEGFQKFGIAVLNKSFLCEINSCKSADNAQANFYFENLNAKGRGGDFVPNIVNNCISYGGNYGFEFNNALVVNITGCTVYQSLSHGYYLHNRSNSVNIAASRSFQVGAEAVYIETSHEVNISSNIFCWQRGHGIVIDNSKWGSVSSNNFIDNGTRTRDGSLRNGVVIKNESQGFQVTSNAIFNWGDQPPMEYGITEDASCSYNIISNNNINYYTKSGVFSEGKESLVNNNIMKGDRAFVGMDRKKQYPDFDTTRIHEFILNE